MNVLAPEGVILRITIEQVARVCSLPAGYAPNNFPQAWRFQAMPFRQLWPGRERADRPRTGGGALVSVASSDRSGISPVSLERFVRFEPVEAEDDISKSPDAGRVGKAVDYLISSR